MWTAVSGFGHNTVIKRKYNAGAHPQKEHMMKVKKKKGGHHCITFVCSAVQQTESLFAQAALAACPHHPSRYPQRLPHPFPGLLLAAFARLASRL
jgi:hypothetical protein